MKISKFTLFIIILFMSGLTVGLFANPIDSENAEKIAKNFYFERGQQVITNLEFESIGLQLYLTKESSEGNVYYIFNTDNNLGFVIISADDDAYPIIGYSFKESYDSENLSPALVERMNNYELQIVEIQTKGLEADAVIRNEWDRLQTPNYNPKSVTSVSPLLSTTWSQGTYYNTDCPVDAAGEDGHVYVGCVATAMAQIMKYYAHPAQGTGSHSYYFYPYGTITANFGSSTYDWASIPNHAYGYNSALALINFHCGVSVDMQYGPDGSGAYTSDVADALVAYFDYASSANHVNKSNYTTTGWENVIVNELDNGRPIEYHGSGPNGGHAFVCDGYQTSSYFHFNWGWGGYADGYFYLNNLNPGGTTFNDGQGAIIGIEPNGGSGGAGETCETALDYGNINDTYIVGATTEADDVEWYAFTLDDDYSNVAISLCGSSFDTKLEVWAACDDVDYIGYNDDYDCAKGMPILGGTKDRSLQSQVDFDALLPGTYFAKVYGYGSGYGDFILSITGESGGTLDPPTDFMVTEDGYGTWTAPGGGGGASAWLFYDDGINVDGIGGPAVFSWAIKFDPDQLADYAGTSITKINIYCRSEATNTLQIFEGTDAAVLLHEQDLSGLVFESWNEVELTTPVAIDATQELWVTVYTEDGANHPAACGTAMGEPNGDLITMDGVVWDHLTDYGLMYTWNLGCYVTDEMGKTVSLGEIPNTKTYNGSTDLFAASGKVNNSPNAIRSKALLGYNLYLDYEIVGTTADLFYQYLDLTAGQTYMGGVSAVYDEGESDIVDYEFTVPGGTLDPPTDFMVTDNGYGTWTAPGGGGGASAWLFYDDGINVDGIGGPAVFSWAIKFDPDQLADYAGTSITKINIYCRSEATNTLQIFEGTGAAVLLHEQDLSGLVFESWNEVELTTPVAIDATQELWVTVYTEDGVNHPAPVGTAMGEPNGDLITLDGATWDHLTDYGLMYTWNLGCYVTDEMGKTVSLGEIPNTKTYNGSTDLFAASGKVNNSPNAIRSKSLLGYNLYLDYAMVGVTADLFYQYADLTGGQTYMGGVSAVYDEGESAIVEYEFTVAGGCNPPEEWTVNPADFAYNGEVTAQVFIDDIAVDNGTLAAFVGDECRGVVDATLFPVTGEYIFTVICYSNMASGETLSFEYFNPITCEICELDASVDFVADMIEGTPDNPLIFICGGPITATVDLSAGWTWFSLNVNDDDMSLDNVLASLSLSENDYIKNQTSSATYYEGYGWYGALTDIDPTQMYQISLAGSDILEYTGMAVDPTSNPINLNAGWTWIGYLPQVDLDINVALASLSLDENDYIKNQTGSATYYDGYGWYGALETLSLYDGYKISLSNADVLTYPTTTMKSAPQSELPIFANNTGITVNPYKYEFNGTVTARVFNNNVLSKSEDDMLLAYVGDECRGISRAMYFEPTDEFAYQLMIYSNIVEGETVMFKYFDSQSNELYECVETIQFTNDMVMADAFNTLDLNTKSTLGINTTIDYAAFNVYPNPSRGITTIDYTLKNTSEVLIVISDIYGKQIKVIENQIKDAGNYSTEWNAEINESGTYFIKIVSNNSIQMRKVVLMK